MNGESSTAEADQPTAPRRFGSDGLQQLMDHLISLGYDVVGPRVADGVIIHDQLRSIDDLPVGWTDEQEGGRYRLHRRDDNARFGYAVGPHSGKNLLHTSRQQVWTMSRDDAGELTVKMHEQQPVRRALFGARPCELAAIAKQDRVLVDGPFPDVAYRTNRRDLFLVAVECGDPAATCFCTSMGTGPSAGPTFDLALTELVGTADHNTDDTAIDDTTYVARAGSPAGAAALAAITTTEAQPEDLSAAEEVVAKAERAISRSIDTDGLKDLIYSKLESDQWDSIAQRCLSCGNCTMACPTCFCTNLEDVTDLGGDNTDRWRVWDSCFSTEFSHLGPGPVRESTGSRYRQWFVHKLASWHDQFDESGCVGCGRCITWCPVGIDLTEELKQMREEPS